LRFPDFVVLLITVGITAFCAVSIYGKSGNALRFIIHGNNQSWIYPIKETTTKDIPGFLGNTVVELKDGRARVVSSPCANKTCVSSGAIHNKGQWVACLPNGVFVRVEAAGRKDRDDGLDATTW
jgi:hypothetical protein